MPPHVTPRNIQEVQESKLGDAQGIPFFINKNLRFSFKTLYLYCFMHYCVALGVSLFLYLVFLALFAAISWPDPGTLLLGERHTPFSLPRTLSFHSYCSASVHFCYHRV